MTASPTGLGSFGAGVVLFLWLAGAALEASLVWSMPTRRASGIVFAAACRKACCMADGVRAADANNAMGRWDSATPLGGLRACVRA